MKGNLDSLEFLEMGKERSFGEGAVMRGTGDMTRLPSSMKATSSNGQGKAVPVKIEAPESSQIALLAGGKGKEGRGKTQTNR